MSYLVVNVLMKFYDPSPKIYNAYNAYVSFSDNAIALH